MKKIIVKITHPWPDPKSEKDPILHQTPDGSGIWGNYRFEVNNDCNECDYWIVAEDCVTQQRVNVTAGNVLLLTTEEVDVKTYEQGFLKQFDGIITSRNDLHWANTIPTHYLNWWFVKRSFDELSQTDYLHKSKEISMIASNLTKTQGHRDRLAFVHKLMNHFKDGLDVYGRGHNFIEDKFDGIAPYKYSIAIENSSIQHYFTEKIIDCYLCNTMPIYFGCPNITDYFHPKSLIVIDIHNFQSAVNTIENAMNADIYNQSIEYIADAKKLALHRYQFFPVVSNILDSLKPLDSNTRKKMITIYPQRNFVSSKQVLSSYKKMLKNGFKIIRKHL